MFESIYREDTVEASARIHRVSRNKGVSPALLIEMSGVIPVLIKDDVCDF